MELMGIKVWIYQKHGSCYKGRPYIGIATAENDLLCTSSAHASSSMV